MSSLIYLINRSIIEIFVFSFIFLFSIFFHEIGHLITLKILNIEHKSHISLKDGVVGFTFNTKYDFFSLLIAFSGIYFGLLAYIFTSHIYFSFRFSYLAVFVYFFYAILYLYGCYNDFLLIKKNSINIIQKEDDNEELRGLL